jgi:rod shape-determining protein MreD
VLIFYWSLKKVESLGYGFIFIAGLINDVVVGLPMGISSLAYLLICGFAAYFRNITLNPSLLKDWFFFLITILVVNSMAYSLLVLFFSYNINYNDLIVNLIFTFLIYVVCANIFEVYQKLAFRNENV